MIPILFPLHTGPARQRRLLAGTKLVIAGTTRDGDGAPLGNCAVTLYRTVDDKVMDHTESDAVGRFKVSIISLGETYYLVAYKVGGIDVSGATINKLVGQSG